MNSSIESVSEGSGLELCDETEPVERMYGEPVMFDGLGILDFVFVPHVDTPGHPETEALSAVAEKYRVEGTRYRAFCITGDAPVRTRPEILPLTS